MASITDPQPGGMLPTVKTIINYDEPESKNPPALSVGPLAWVRENLFSSFVDALLTVALTIGVIFAIIGMINWVVGDANWFVINNNVRLFLRGFYPDEKVWRLWVLFAVVAFLAGYSLASWARVSIPVALVIVALVIVAFIGPRLIESTLEAPPQYMAAGDVDIVSGTITERPQPEVAFIADADSEITITLANEIVVSEESLSDPAGFADRASVAVFNAAVNRRAIETRIAEIERSLAEDRLTDGQRTELTAELETLEVPPPVLGELQINQSPVVVTILDGQTLEPLLTETLSSGDDRITFDVPDDGWYVLEKSVDGEGVGLLRGININPLIERNLTRDETNPTPLPLRVIVYVIAALAYIYVIFINKTMLNGLTRQIVAIGGVGALIFAEAALLSSGATILIAGAVIGLAAFLLYVFTFTDVGRGFYSMRNLAAAIATAAIAGGIIIGVFEVIDFTVADLGFIPGEVISSEPVARGQRMLDGFAIESPRPRIDDTNVPLLNITNNQYRGTRPLDEFMRMFVGPALDLIDAALLLFVAVGALAYAASILINQYFPRPHATNRRYAAQSLGLRLWGLFPFIMLILLIGTDISGTRLWGGLLLTFFITVFGIALSFPIGILAALGRRSNLPVVKIISVLYIEIVRGVPLITILFLANLMVPLIHPSLADVPGVIRVGIGVILFVGAYLAENVRGGLQSVPPGQEEAAKAVGLNNFQVTLYITLPQALRAVIPALVGMFISLYKDTSLVVIVGLIDLTGSANSVIAQTEFIGLRREAYVFIAVIYFVFSYIMSIVSRRIEASGAGAATQRL